MEAQIKNINLEGDRIVVYALINNREETCIFTPDNTIQDIKSWVKDRLKYHKKVEKQVIEMKEELLDKKYSI